MYLNSNQSHLTIHVVELGTLPQNCQLSVFPDEAKYLFCGTEVIYLQFYKNVLYLYVYENGDLMWLFLMCTG